MSNIEQHLHMFTDWVDRYQFILQLGRNSRVPLSRLSGAQMVNQHFNIRINVQQYASRVYVFGTSTNQFVNGLIAVIMKLINGTETRDIIEPLTRLGIIDHLTPEYYEALLDIQHAMSAYQPA